MNFSYVHKGIIKALPPALVGAAIALFFVWMFSPVPFSAKDAAKMQIELIQAVKDQEERTRKGLQSRIDSLDVLLLQSNSKIEAAMQKRDSLNTIQQKTLNQIKYLQHQNNEKFNSIDFDRINQLDDILKRTGIN